MPGIEVIQTGVDGLDLALGGGLRLLRRIERAEASATLLLRGPPGSGKTLVGMLIATAVARQLGGDVVCGCVEILPLELAAQLEGLDLSGVGPVLVAPFTDATASSRADQARLFAALLDVGAPGEEERNLEGALCAVLETARNARGRPRVLVIDSLSDGYQLGASAPRELADGVCKLAAEQGLVLVMMEETVDWEPSGWSFASDTVIELGATEDDDSSDLSNLAERPLMVVKNRLGPSDAGPHHFALEDRGARVFPRPVMYTRPWAEPLLLPGIHGTGGGVTVVYGNSPSLVAQTAYGQGDKAAGTDVLGYFGAPRNLPGSPCEHIQLDNPYMSPHRLLVLAMRAIERAHKGGAARIGRVFIGDFSALRNFSDGQGIRRATAVLARLLRQHRMHLILFETTEMAASIPQFCVASTPSIAALADQVVLAAGGSINEMRIAYSR